MSEPRERRNRTRLIDRAARRPSRVVDTEGAVRRDAAPPAVHDNTTEARRSCDTATSLATRDALVVAHTDLVRSIAYRIGQRLPAHVDRGDLVSVGMIGLLEAATRYRPSTGVPFEAFARRRVHGAIMDSLRELDWVPRSVRSLQRRANSVAATLRQELGREPSRDEIATRIGVHGTSAEANRVLHTVAPTEPLHDDLSALEQWPDTGESVEARLLRAEVAARVRREVARLPAREQRILERYYRHDQRMAEIGQAIGVCESRVSQLRSAALNRLRVMLVAALGLESAAPARPDTGWAAVLLEGGLSRPAPSRVSVAASADAAEAPACRAA